MKSITTQTAQQLHPSEKFPLRHSAIALAIAGLAMLAPHQVYAAEAVAADTANQDEPLALDAVVIRSRNRIERLQDVPVSESVVTGKELERLGATDIGAITQRAGNVSWNQGNQRTSSLSIRGIGKQGQTEAQDPGVGLIVDGVSYAYNALSSSYDFTDVDTVEVARGPQGTLLGKNSSYGSIVVNTVRPSFTPSSNFSLTAGQLGTVKGTAAIGGALIDELVAWRGSFSASKAQGQFPSTTNQDNTYTNTDRLTGRAQFLITPSESFSALVSFNSTPNAGEFTNQRTINTMLPATYSNGVTPTAGITTDVLGRLSRSWFTQNQGFTPNSIINADNIPALNARPLITGSNGGSAQLNWTLGGHTLTSITAVQNYYFDAVNDSGIPFDVYRNAGGFKNNYTQTSQELRLSSPLGGFVDYQTGLYAISVRNQNDYQRAWGNDAGAYLASTAQYGRLNANTSGQVLMKDSLSGLTMHFNSPAGLQDIRNLSEALYGQANWHFSEPLTLTTGLRITQENRRNTGSSGIVNNGNGAALNPVAVNGVSLGGFSSNASTGVLGANDASQLALANQVAKQYFGAASYAALTAAQMKQVADAKAVRATAIGVVFNQSDAAPFNAVQPSFVISPSYKVDDNLTTYASIQYGEKAGVSQFTNGISNPVKAEKTTSYEAGFKSKLLHDTLIFNSAIFLMNVKDYQQSTQVLDEYTTNLKNDGTLYYTGATGNVPWVQAKGVEIDGVYSGIANTSIRFSGAYNDAVYKDFTNSAQPAEVTGAGPYRDVTGQTLPGASKWTGNIGVDYRKPVFGNLVFHTSFNTVYRSGSNSDVALSSYAWIGASTLTDIAIGWGKKDQSFDANLLVKNVFDNRVSLTQTWNTYTPALPRWIGVMFTAKN